MIVELPLTKANRIRVARAFAAVPRVDLSIDCVIEGQMGQVFVDDVERPTVYKLVIGPFHYLAGDAGSDAAAALLDTVPDWSLLMASADGWWPIAQAHFGVRLSVIERNSFTDEAIDDTHLTRLIEESPWRESIRPIDLDIGASVYGKESIADLSDFDSAEDFVARSNGYCLMVDDQIKAVAYGSMACGKGLEVSVFVDESLRRQGVATALSASHVRWCLRNGTHASWDAANPASSHLAKKLGYTPAGAYTAYVVKGS